MCALLSDDLEWKEKPEEGREVVSQQFACNEMNFTENNYCVVST